MAVRTMLSVSAGELKNPVPEYAPESALVKHLEIGFGALRERMDEFVFGDEVGEVLLAEGGTALDGLDLRERKKLSCLA